MVKIFEEEEEFEQDDHEEDDIMEKMISDEDKDYKSYKILEIEHVLRYLEKLFVYHADQRLRTFRYFLIYVIAALIGFSTLYKDGDHKLLLFISAFSFFVTLMFFVLEWRSKKLVDNAIEACQFMEDELVKWLPTPKGHKTMSEDEKSKYYNKVKLMNKSWEDRPRFLNFNNAVKTIYVLSLVMNILVFLFAMDHLNPFNFFDK